jgi:hypothetical protein
MNENGAEQALDVRASTDKSLRRNELLGPSPSFSAVLI